MTVLLTTTSGDGQELSNTATVTAGPLQVEPNVETNSDVAQVQIEGPASQLPRTGQNILPIALVGLILLVAGGLLVIVARRRSEPR